MTDVNVAEFGERVRAAVGRAVVGQDAALDQVITCLLANGHVLLEGVPGVAKTLTVRAVARALGCGFRRVQFTPDMLPSDLTGTLTYRSTKGDFVFRPGPVFTSFLLADEINRTPPKTQSALLEVMQERQVTVEGEAHPVPEPFLVAATQNPVEYEGTYPLPEAQLDRFLMKVEVGYPDEGAEMEMLRRHQADSPPDDVEASVPVVSSGQDVVAAIAACRRVQVQEPVMAYALRIVRATRAAPAAALGASPRAAVALVAAARARAALAGRAYVVPDDVALVATPVLRHRLILRPEAELERYRADDVVRGALAQVPVPR